MADKTNDVIPEEMREVIDCALSELWREGELVWLHKNNKGRDVFTARFRATPMQVLDSELELQRREGIKPRLD